MKKKQEWMFVGAQVRALGRKAVITKMQETTIKGEVYVNYITVKVDGENVAGRYHPDDVKKYEP